MVLFNSTATILQSFNSTPQPAVKSRCSPWLTPFVYFLGHKVVVPNYFGEVKVTGQERLPIAGPVILAPTHRSRWDAILLSLAAGRVATGRDLRFMVTSTEVQGLQGCLIRRLGGFAINLAKPGIASLRHGIELLRQREMLVIFPEGGIFREPTVKPLKQGLARLALQAESMQPGLGVKIVPVSLQYDQLYPGKGCGVTLNIGEPLNVAQYGRYRNTAEGSSMKQQARTLTQDLRAALMDLSQSAAPELASVD